jgi:hypothetical protein
MAISQASIISELHGVRLTEWLSLLVVDPSRPYPNLRQCRDSGSIKGGLSENAPPARSEPESFQDRPVSEPRDHGSRYEVFIGS